MRIESAVQLLEENYTPEILDVRSKVNVEEFKLAIQLIENEIKVVVFFPLSEKKRYRWLCSQIQRLSSN